jgi:hypothetical protein
MERVKYERALPFDAAITEFIKQSWKFGGKLPALKK